MRNQVILHQTSLSEFTEMIGNVVEEKLKTLQLPLTKHEPKFYTREETAKILSVTLPTLHSYTKNGTIQGTRIGSRVLYRLSDIESALQNIKHIKHGRG
jgi:excisionase family DNA binding protein